MNADEKQSAPVTIFFWDGEKLLRMRSLAKRRRERIGVLEDLLNHYRADFSAAYNRVRILRKENQDLCDRLNLCGG